MTIGESAPFTVALLCNADRDGSLNEWAGTVITADGDVVHTSGPQPTRQDAWLSVRVFLAGWTREPATL
jgi:hypothetical protein